jgi:hypothetical protein
MTRSRLRPLLAAATLVGALSGARLASADILTLHGGATLEGKVVEQGANDIVFEHEIGGQKVRSTFPRSTVDKIEITAGLGSQAAPAGGAPATRYPEAQNYSKRVGIVIDRSGSMSIGDRWAQELDEVDAILAALPDSTEVALWVFDKKPTALFPDHPKAAAARKTVRPKLEAMGFNLEGYTDIVAALVPALHASCEAVYLLTDGFPTQGEPSVDFVVKGVKNQLKLLPPPKNVPLDIVQIEGGKYELGDVEEPEGARAILKALANETVGVYRSVVAADRPKTTAAIRPLKGDGPAADDVTFHLYQTDGYIPAQGMGLGGGETGGLGIQGSGKIRFDPSQQLNLREFVNVNFLIEVEDPALQRGPVILEYATKPHAPRIELESYASAATGPAVFDTKRDLRPLRVWNGIRESEFNAFSAVEVRLGTLRLYQRIHIVRGLDDKGRHQRRRQQRPGQRLHQGPGRRRDGRHPLQARRPRLQAHPLHPVGRGARDRGRRGGGERDERATARPAARQAERSRQAEREREQVERPLR